MKKTFKIIFLIFSVIVLFLAIGSAGYFYYQYQSAVKNNSVSEIDQLVETVSGFMELPDEVPTLATVSDKTKLENQQFFQNAQNGDKVLFFTSAQIAILYRPSSKKIINLAPTRNFDQETTPSVEQSQEATTSAEENQ